LTRSQNRHITKNKESQLAKRFFNRQFAVPRKLNIPARLGMHGRRKWKGLCFMTDRIRLGIIVSREAHERLKAHCAVRAEAEFGYCSFSRVINEMLIRHLPSVHLEAVPTVSEVRTKRRRAS
jgi:hypothetical protein